MTKPILLLLACLAGAATCAAAEEPAQWILVTAPAFRDSLASLVEHRRTEGLRVVVVTTTDVLTPEQVRRGESAPLKTHLDALCRQSKGTNYVLLAGAPSARDPATAEQTVVPMPAGKISRMKGQPSDNGYGCLGTELMPTVAVGRFPARNAEEARSMAQKTLALERDSLPGLWRSRLTVLVGNPGVEGGLVEWGAQAAIWARFSRLHPAWSVRTVVDSVQSPFCVPSNRLRDMTTRLIEDGEVFSFYMGHSDASGFFLTREDWSRLKIRRGAGVFFTCGCHACRLDGDGPESYGMAAMRNPDGPAAVMGPHGESYAAMGRLALDGLVDRLSAPLAPVRLGDCWLSVKSGLARGPMDPLTFYACDHADGSNGTIPLAVQRREHLEMWTLLGDPALRLPIQPLEIRLEAEGPVLPGENISAKGVLPDRLAGATVRVTLERMVVSAPADIEPLPKQPGEARDHVMTENHRRANSVVLATCDVPARGTRFECAVEPPGKLPWPKLVLRACAEKGNESAIGVVTLPVSDAHKP